MPLKIDKVNEDIRVVDNLLPEKVFRPLQHWFTEGCRWQYCPYILGDGEDTDPDAYQFVHMFWDPCLGVVSQIWNVSILWLRLSILMYG